MNNQAPALNRALITKHPGGAPTKYNEPLLDKVIEYANSYESLGHKVPSIAGLCTYIGVTRETMYQWIKIHKELSDITSRMLAQQEQTLLNNGLDGTFNAHITKLVLSKHGYTDNANNNNNIQIVVSRDGVAINDKQVIEHEE